MSSGFKTQMSDAEHQRFVRKNQMIALAEQPIIKDDRGNTVTKKTCGNCFKRRNCKVRGVKIRDGVASVGGDEIKCDQWAPLQSEKMNAKKVKSLMKNFKRLR